MKQASSRKPRSAIWVQLGCNKTSRGFLRAPRVAIGAVKLQLVTSERWTVTAEVASSSLVVPAILSKALRRISLKPLGARKGRVSRPFCALLGDPELPIQQRVLLHPHRKKRLATSPPPALHASRALLPACKRPTLSGTTNAAAAAPASP